MGVLSPLLMGKRVVRTASTEGNVGDVDGNRDERAHQDEAGVAYNSQAMPSGS
jgi:hypothetical protein